jgi:hypothetical protein
MIMTGDLPKLKITKTAATLGDVSVAPQTADTVGSVSVNAPLVEDMVFRPTADMRKLKASFYMKTRGSSIDIAHIDVDQVHAYTPHERLRGWWRNPEFVAWFRNTDEHRSRVFFLLDQHLTNLQTILENVSGEYTVRDQLAAGKQVMELQSTYIAEDRYEKEEKAVALRASPDLVKQIAAKIIEEKKKREIDNGIVPVPRPSLPIA